MFIVISIEESNRWDDIVKQFENYDVYYLSGYVKAFQLHGDGEPLLIYFKNDDIRAINVVMKRDVGADENLIGKMTRDMIFDLSTPYGYGGLIVEGNITAENLNELNFEYTQYCKTNNIVSEFVRFHPIIKNSKCAELIYHTSTLGKTIAIELKNKDQIWSDLTSKTRNMVRKAQKNGVKVFLGKGQSLIDEFIPLYNATMDRDNATSYYYFNKEFYSCIRDDLKQNSLFFYAVYEGKIIAMAIILHANRQMHYHLSALDKKYQKLASMNLLLYEAAVWGYENGHEKFHLGGGLGSKEDGLFKFKNGFNRKSDYDFCIGNKIFIEAAYSELLSIREKEESFKSKTNFFPAYRS